MGDVCSIPGLGRSLGGKHGHPLQYSCLENPHRKRSLAGYSTWDHKESDTMEQLNTAQNSNRFVTAFLPRSKCLLISWLQSPSALILEPKKIKSVTVSIVSLSICHEYWVGKRQMICNINVLKWENHTIKSKEKCRSITFNLNVIDLSYFCCDVCS